MKALICTQCGGTINPSTMRCEYCGTRYERTEDLTKPLRVIYSSEAKPQILQSKIAFNNQDLNYIPDTNEIARIVHSRITTQLAEALEPYVEYTVQEDPVYREQVIRGRVRVLPPGYNFE